MKKIMKRAGAILCALSFAVLSCVSIACAAEPVATECNRMLPDVIEGPMRRAVRDGSQAIDDIASGDNDNGTVVDSESNGSVADHDTTASDTRDNGSASESDTSGGMDATDDKDGGKIVGILIAIAAIVVIIILVLVAIPKSKAKPGGPDKR